jgi:hypothetical protein
MLKPFCPSPASSFYIPNAITASTPVAIPDGCDQLMLYNSSATAIAFLRVATLPSNTDAGVNATFAGLAAAPGGFPVPPGHRFVISVGFGAKRISAIASIADGNLLVTPGNGF